MTQSALTSSFYDFLIHDGEMGAVIRRHRWEASVVGPISRWPANLRVAIRLLLSSTRPMMLWWSDSFVHFYNDAYSRTLPEDRRYALLGVEGVSLPDPGWQAIRSTIASVKNGKGPSAGVDAAVPNLWRSGVTYWDYELLPIDGEGGVAGVLGILRDASADHVDDEGLAAETSRLMDLFEQTPGFICILTGPDHVFSFVNAEYRNLMGERDYIGKPVRAVVPEVEGQGFFELLDKVYRTGETYVGRNLPMTYVRPGETEARTTKVSLVYKALKSADGTAYGIFVEGTSSDDQRLERRLSLREREVLGWIAAGKTANETAHILGLSRRTCEKHIYSAARKLATSNSTHTIVEAIKRGEIDLDHFKTVQSMP